MLCNKKTKLNIFILLMAVAVFLLGMGPDTIEAAVVYVDAGAGGSNDGLSWTNAYSELQDALAVAVSGDEIWVAAGTYKPGSVRTDTFQLINGVEIYGGFAGTETSLADRDWKTNETILSGDLGGNDVGFTNNGENSYHVVTGSGMDETAVLDGFTITAGNANSGSYPDNCGGGMYNWDSSPTVTNCTFSGNSASNFGGGMYNVLSSPTVTNCTFSGNSSRNGGGMYNREDSSPTVTNCTFSGNSASNIGGGMRNYDHSSPTVTDCTFTGNSAHIEGGGLGNHGYSSPTLTNCSFSGNSAYREGGGLGNRNVSSPTLTNCSFSRNSAPVGGVMSNRNYSSPTVRNCILWGPTSSHGGNEIYNYSFSSIPVISYCDIAGDYGGTGNNITANPLFVDADGPDDIFGTEDDDLRLSPGSPCIDAGANTAVPGSVTTDLDGNARFVDDPGTADTGNGTPPIVDMGAYEYKPFIFVDADASGANDGTSWADAYNYFQDALAEAASGDEIWVAAETYTPDPAGLADPREATFQLASGVIIYGGFPSGGGVWQDRNPNAYETILSGDLNEDDGADFANNGENSYHVVEGSGTDETAVLDGFTITAGNANGDFLLWDARFCGGGMVNWGSGRPTVANCTFTGNSANFGGGMCNYHGSPTVTDCTFSGNTGSSGGGGMFNMTDSNPTVNNCIFIGNSAAGGGGMENYTYSSPILTNCTFSGNSGGGLYNYNYCSPTVTNCTFTGNSTDRRGGGMYNLYFCDPTVTNCIFSGNSANYGGAMFTSAACAPRLTNCTFSQNSAPNGKALGCRDTGGYTPPSTLEVTNCILWDGGAEIWNYDGATITINYSDVEGGETGVYDPDDGLVWGAGNIDVDPLFDDADLRLSAGSPCIDAGDNTAVPVGVTTDLDSNPRFMDDPGTVDTGNGTAPIVDMGAYEFPNTSTGTNVIVHWDELERAVIVVFADVTAPGVTSLTTSSSGPEPPTGSMAGDPETYYDITTTATYNGDIGVSIDYSETSFVGSEEDLRLYHYESGAWVDATVLPVDTENNIICGTVSSLSPFAIFEPEENQPPVVGAISAPLEPVQVSTEVTANAGFSDPDIGDTHTATWDWGDDSISPGTVGTGTVSGTYTYIIPGVYTVTLTLTDATGASDQAVFQYVVVYDPGAGFVTGGGWIHSEPGSLITDLDAEGKASFGFVAKYKKGATVPTGNTEFRFRAGNFRFKSSSYEWLVVAGKKAMFKGEGSIDGMDGSFKFMLTGVDDTEDKFRIKISDPAGEDPIYDNKRGEGNDAEPTTIGGGSIVIHGG